METKHNYLPHRDPSRPDRSRSPHREHHPWENGGEPKSVLYPADIQFHRQGSSKLANNRSAYKSSGSPSRLTKTPSKERSQIPRLRNDYSSQQYDPNGSVRKVAERMQKWNEMYSPPKFMAGLRQKNENQGTTKLNQSTPKSRKCEPWTVEYFTKEPLIAGRDDQNRANNSGEKSHPSKENIRVIERPSRRANSPPTIEEWRRTKHDPSNHNAASSQCASAVTNDKIVEMDADGYAIPTVEVHTSPSTPRNKGLSTPLTPGNVSPNELFYTPMTHVRPSQPEEGVTSSPFYSNTCSQSTAAALPQFSLITGNSPAVNSPFQRDISIKERTEEHLAAFDKMSSKLDIAIQQAKDVLSKPIRLGLPAFDNSAIPLFSDSRQTIDHSQLENLRRRKEDNVNANVSEPKGEFKPHRHSLPPEFDYSNYNELSNAAASSLLNRSVDDAVNELMKTHGANKEPLVENELVHLKEEVEISMPKVLGASMAAELAYADRMEKAQSHLRATRALARKVDKDMENAQPSSNDNIDAVLDSIVLHDNSSVAFDSEADRSLHRTRSPSSDTVFKPALPIFQQRPIDDENAIVDEGEREERKAHIESYVRMQKHLHNLQLVALRLRKRSAASSAQSKEIDQLIENANEQHEKTVEDAQSILDQRLTPREFLMLIKHRQQKVLDATERCSDTIKRLLNLDVPEVQRKLKHARANEKSRIERDHRPVRVDTEALNDNAGGDAGDLSARTLRRNLEARREQVEKLNKSFEEKSRDIEQKTRKSIAVQIVNYDRVILERTHLIDHLEKISQEERYEIPVLQPRTPTPLRDGVAPLDLSQLSDQISDELEAVGQNEEALPTAESMRVGNDEDQADVGISRAYSQSTVYEDSHSHFSDEEGRPSSMSSEATLYQSDLEDRGFEVLEAKEKGGQRIPSRRTLDTAETLAMLSRSVVTIATTNSERDDVDQKIQRVTNDTIRENAFPQEEVHMEVHLTKVNTAEEVSMVVEAPTTDTCALNACVAINLPAKTDPCAQDNKASSQREKPPDDYATSKEPSNIEEKCLAAGDIASPSEAFSASIEVCAVKADNSEMHRDYLVARVQDDERTTALVRPPKDFSRLRLFFGSPDEPTEDSIDLQQSDDDIPNDHFVSKGDPTSELVAEETEDSEKVPGNASLNESDDEDVPVITLRSFVYKELVMGEELHIDSDLDGTQWEKTDPERSPVRMASETLLVEETSLNEAYVGEISNTQKSDETNEMEMANEWLTDDERHSIEERDYENLPTSVNAGQEYKEAERRAPAENITLPRTEGEVREDEKLKRKMPTEHAGFGEISELSRIERDIHNDKEVERMALDSFSVYKITSQDDKKGESEMAAKDLDLATTTNAIQKDNEQERNVHTCNVGLLEHISTANLSMLEQNILEGKEAGLQTAAENLVHSTREDYTGEEEGTGRIASAEDVDFRMESTQWSESDDMIEQVVEKVSLEDAQATEDVAEISGTVRTENPKSNAGKGVVELEDASLLERTTDGRPSLGLNRSELCDSLSSSILHLMADSASPRRRTLQQQRNRYQLSESLLEDTTCTSPRSPRTPQERFTTKMPSAFSPRYNSLLEQSFDTSLPDVIAKSEVVMALTDEKINEIEKEMAQLNLKDPSAEKSDTVSTAKLDLSLSETYEDLFSIEKPSSAFENLSSTPVPPVNPIVKHVADTPRKSLPQVAPAPSPEAIKRQRLEELKERLNSEKWKKDCCHRFSKEVWRLLISRGSMRLLYDEITPAPEFGEGVLVETEDERMLLDNKKTLIWAAVIELAAVLWPEHPEDGPPPSSKWFPIPKNETEFSEMAERYMFEQLNDLPPSHRYKRQSRPPAPPYADTIIDETVARYCYSQNANSFACKVHVEYRKLCEEVIDLVEDHFISSETQRLLHGLGTDGNMSGSFLSHSQSHSQSGAFGQLSGDFGRPSLTRLSISSGVSIGRCSTGSAVVVPPLGVVHEE